MKKTVVLYHKNCADGFGAAVAAWMKFRAAAEYIPCQYGDEVPASAKEAGTVYILDFSFPRDALIELASGRRVVVLDHHETAEAELAGLELPNDGVVRFSKHESGAVMSWAFLWKLLDADVKIPELLLYVQDRDLWQWSMPHSREISVALQHAGFVFLKWSNFITFWKEAKPKLIQVGSILLENQRRRIDGLCEHPRFLTWNGAPVAAVNSPLDQSEIGECLLQKYPQAKFACIYFQKENGDWVHSLRARAGEVNVGAVAKGWEGGGGHACAAGFTSKILTSVF
jgi:oligoribonuclease NrnB/cAMP/cGMP phosphodiesterase (DHH superfamily)